jgi:hypothetical protein
MRNACSFNCRPQLLSRAIKYTRDTWLHLALINAGNLTFSILIYSTINFNPLKNHFENHFDFHSPKRI